MKLLVVLIFVAAATALQIDENFSLRHGIPPARDPDARASRPTWGLITQRQDNFNPTNLNTWEMRYIENGQFWKPGGPIFIMLGAEWTIDSGWLQSGQMFDLAEIHNAQMFYTEHRYYGESFPVENLTTPNLIYLTVDQALADVAHFIVTVRENNTELANSKVIVFGGSYGGTMATWMRQKYPHLVHGAVSSSAPLLAQVDFPEYYGVVQNALGPKCSSILVNASKEIRRLLKEGNNAKVEQDFNLCSPIAGELDVEALYSYLSGLIAGQVQYAQSNTIRNLCNQLSNPDLPSDYDRAVAYYSNVYCRADYETSIRSMNYTKLSSRNIMRQWFYQTCINFGFFQTTWGENSLFNYGVSVDYYHQHCLDLFGISPESTTFNVAATNREHGGFNPAVTRLVSVHGSADPWHALGVIEDVNPSSPSYLVHGTSHCMDMYSDCATEEMCNVKKEVAKYVAQWLTEPY